nr:DNA polymerase epsilon subunit B like [Ipomoea batatas]
MEAAAMELEDDVFFADLSRQISLLIMDDEDVETSTTHCSSVSLQALAFSEVMHYPKIGASSELKYEQMGRRESKGTGVFIPCSSYPTRRKNKQPKFSSSYNYKSQRSSSHNSPPLSNSSHNKNLHTNSTPHHFPNSHSIIN